MSPLTIRTVVLDNGGLRRNSQNTNNKLIRTRGVDNSKINIAQLFSSGFLGMYASCDLPTQASARTKGIEVERGQAKDKEYTVAFKSLVQTTASCISPSIPRS